MVDGQVQAPQHMVLVAVVALVLLVIFQQVVFLEMVG
jgi:hypothetical protein